MRRYVGQHEFFLYMICGTLTSTSGSGDISAAARLDDASDNKRRGGKQEEDFIAAERTNSRGRDEQYYANMYCHCGHRPPAQT